MRSNAPCRNFALQEAPRGSWATTAFAGYVSMGAVPSHCGYVVLLLKRALAARATKLKLPATLYTMTATFKA